MRGGTHFHANSVAHRHIRADGNGYAIPNSDAHPCADGNGNCGTFAYPSPYGHADCNANAYSSTDGDGASDS